MNDIVLQTKINSHEPFNDFESKCEAAVSSYNSTASNKTLQQSLVAFILIGNDNLNDGLCVSILSASAQNFGDSSE